MIDPDYSHPEKEKAIAKADAKLKGFFQSQRVEVSRAIGKHLKAKKASADKDAEQRADEIIASLSWAVWDGLVPDFQDLLGSTGTEAVSIAMEALEDAEAGRDVFSLSKETVMEYARNRAAEMVGRKWVDGVLVDNPNAQWAITSSTREYLRELVCDALNSSWTPSVLAQKIDESIAFGSYRAELIARTETAMAYTAATVDVGKRVGATTKTIQMSNLHDVDDVCDAAHEAGEVPIDKPYPGGSLHVPLHPNCRCVEMVHVPKKGNVNGGATE